MYTVKQFIHTFKYLIDIHSDDQIKQMSKPHNKESKKNLSQCQNICHLMRKVNSKIDAVKIMIFCFKMGSLFKHK